jgi:hypothetical protein
MQLFLGDSMKREDIPMLTRCATNPDDRTRVLITIEPNLDDLLSVVDEAERFVGTTTLGKESR